MKQKKGSGRTAKLANKYFQALHCDLRIAEIYAGKLAIASKREKKAKDKIQRFDFATRAK